MNYYTKRVVHSKSGYFRKAQFKRVYVHCSFSWVRVNRMGGVQFSPTSPWLVFSRLLTNEEILASHYFSSLCPISCGDRLFFPIALIK